ncbi:MAG: alpha/beta hydrolase fold domain-containing protein [Gammaproteobacteria bacterium]|nr:alpha/beta hydrolase fold domain-containing protein [Gammaproteobacteria bacterium]
MKHISSIIRLLLAVFRAVLVRVVHRLLCGPAVASWSWGVELRVVALRAFMAACDERGNREGRRWIEEQLDPPLPRELHGLVEAEPGVLGGVPGEWLRRTGFDDTTTLLYLHGGGYISGNPATHRHFAGRLTWAAATKTFVLDYRLAPKHRFPAALDDAIAAYEDLISSGVDPESLFVAGDSAGGGLACALLLWLRDVGHSLPAGTILFSPYTDLEHTGASISANAVTDYLPLTMGNAQPNTIYLGDHDPRDPLASPMHGDFTGLPPLLIFAGSREMILDDSIRLAEKARRDGAEVTLHIEPDMMHVWPAIIPRHPASLKAFAITAEFVRCALRPSTGDRRHPDATGDDS